MLEHWRLLDTGLAAAGRNIALNRALLESRHADESPSTLRFLRFAPGVLLASRQSAAEELNSPYCAASKLAVQRRITSGVTWVVDERQLGWELYLHRRELGTISTETLAKRAGHAAATALAALGMDARYRARDEIEVDGRVVCMFAHAAEGQGVLVQALLLLDPDLERAALALRSAACTGHVNTDTPDSDHVKRAIAALTSRTSGLKAVLGRLPDPRLVRRNLTEAFESEFDVEFREGDLNLTEHERYLRAVDEIESRGWIELVARPARGVPIVEAVQRVPGGNLRAALKYEVSTRTIKEVWFSGDVMLNPRRSLNDLEAALRNISLERLERQVSLFFASRAIDRGSIQPAHFVAVVRLAAGQPLAA
jgi:lipoate-protein ligase A